MKKKKMNFIYCVMVLGIFSLLACSGDMLMAPGEEEEGQLTVLEQKKIPTDQINWISWTPEFTKNIRALSKDATSTVLIKADEGGIVGGEITFGNRVEIPSGALSEDTEVSVSVHCMDEDDDEDSCVGAVEFLPDTQFNKMVSITVSYGDLDYSGSPYDIKISWTKSFTDNGWTEVEVKGVDTSSETLSFEIDHFTRYAWHL